MELHHHAWFIVLQLFSYICLAGKLERILSLSPVPKDQDCLRIALGRISKVRTCREAYEMLCKERIVVIVCEKDLPDGNWKDILSHLARMAEPPCLIVTSRLADDHLWAEALNLGAYDVLATPFDRGEVCRAVSSAWLHWKYELKRVKEAPTALRMAAGGRR